MRLGQGEGGVRIGQQEPEGGKGLQVDGPPMAAATPSRRSRGYLQQAGASARERLIQAAANQWRVSASSCTAKDSVVTHPATGRTLRYGELASAAANIQLAQEPAIKTPDQFTLMGKSLARLDTPVKVNGSAIFRCRCPAARTCCLPRSKTSPIVGAKLKSYDFSAIKNRPGVHSVVEFQGRRPMQQVCEAGWPWWPTPGGEPRRLSSFYPSSGTTDPIPMSTQRISPNGTSRYSIKKRAPSRLTRATPWAL